MTYTEWFKEQTTERQELSLRLMETAQKLGEANRNRDEQARIQLEQEVKKIYEEISKY
jgi:hypothetical protein